MKVFISWSGERSKAVAEALHGWLPKVVQAVRPWMSSTDIDKGAQWFSEISEQLAGTSFGIICLTPENLDSPWLHFEAGALLKAIPRSRVCPLLFDLEPADVKGPLTQFQMTRAGKAEMRELVRTLNSTLEGGGLVGGDLDEAFDLWWQKIEPVLDLILPSIAPDRPKRTDRDVMEEILELQRTQLQMMQSRPFESIGMKRGLQVFIPELFYKLGVRGELEAVSRFCSAVNQSSQVGCQMEEHPRGGGLWEISFERPLATSRAVLDPFAKHFGVEIRSASYILEPIDDKTLGALLESAGS